MADTTRISQYYRKKLEQHELTPEEWVAVRYAVIKHTLIAAATTVTLGSAAFFYAGNLVGLSVGGLIAMESGMKTVENRLQGSGSELLYLMDRYSKASLKEKLGDNKDTDSGLSSYGPATSSDNTVIAPRMIRTPQDNKSE
ncbi:hypothetical protein BGW39_011618 [Mortierella sp. 14UC]|nr:hypothetical protein BGW39_011618 [Mortierella sp. 14UC]